MSATAVEDPIRMARCTTCWKECPSSPNLPFFRSYPDSDYDTFYCGCLGWH